MVISKSFQSVDTREIPPLLSLHAQSLRERKKEKTAKEIPFTIHFSLPGLGNASEFPGGNNNGLDTTD
jgi:hypothetical protein